MPGVRGLVIPVEKLPSLRAGPRCQADIAGEKRDGQPCSCAMRKSIELGTIDFVALLASSGDERRGGAARAAIGFESDDNTERILAESNELRVSSTSKRAEQDRIVGCFEEIGLPLAVGAQQYDARFRNPELAVGKVPVSPDFELSQPH